MKAIGTYITGFAIMACMLPMAMARQATRPLHDDEGRRGDPAQIIVESGREQAALPARRRGAATIRRQLMITDLGVVEDPMRTRPRRGGNDVWTFKHLITQMAGDHDPAAFAMHWLELWERDQEINGFVSPARPGIRERVIEPWLRASGGRRLDLNRAPFKLLAIVNRMDLRVHVGEEVLTGGEGRFVFGVLGPDGRPLPPIAGTVPGGFMVIFEYELPATDMQALGEWTMAWKRLENYRLGSDDYNRALENITRAFTDRGQAPDKPNGSALNQLRSIEVALGAPWELREFVIDPDTGWLVQQTVALNPDTLTLNGTPEFAEFINTAGLEIAAGTAELSPDWFAASALSGPFVAENFDDFAARTFVTNELFHPFYDIPWSAAGIEDNDVRHTFALNTCNGCHRDETGTDFLQIGFPENHQLPRSLGSPAQLAGFLTGIEVPDPVESDTIRSFADLERRRLDFADLCASFGPDGRGPGPNRRSHIPRFVH